MTARQKEILKHLQEGKSYTDIQAALSVGPSQIAVVKKRFFNILAATPSTPSTTTTTQEVEPLSSTNDALLGTTTPVEDLEKMALELEKELDRVFPQKEAISFWENIKKNHPEIYEMATDHNMNLDEVNEYMTRTRKTPWRKAV